MNRRHADKGNSRRPFKTLICAAMFAVASVLFVPDVGAQEIVTLALVNGERPSGALVDLNAKGFVLRVGSEERYYAANDVAAIEFVVAGPTSAATAALNRGQSVVVLRDGTMIEGRLTDIGGTQPLRLTIDTASGTRDLRSSDIAQVHLRRTNQATVAATTGTTAGAGITASEDGTAIVVAANTAWTDTNINVARLDRIQLAGSGDIMVSPQASAGVAGAEIKAAGRLPVPTAPVGSLIARIGNGTPFLVGARDGGIQMPSSGRLYLGINDEHFDDNTGSFTVTVTKLPRLAR